MYVGIYTSNTSFPPSPLGQDDLRKRTIYIDVYVGIVISPSPVTETPASISAAPLR